MSETATAAHRATVNPINIARGVVIGVVLLAVAGWVVANVSFVVAL